MYEKEFHIQIIGKTSGLKSKLTSWPHSAVKIETLKQEPPLQPLHIEPDKTLQVKLERLPECIVKKFLLPVIGNVKNNLIYLYRPILNCNFRILGQVFLDTKIISDVDPEVLNEGKTEFNQQILVFFFVGNYIFQVWT